MRHVIRWSLIASLMWAAAHFGNELGEFGAQVPGPSPERGIVVGLLIGFLFALMIGLSALTYHVTHADFPWDSVWLKTKKFFTA